MAKMFYTLDEVCDKLGKSEDEVKEMARSGQIQEFRDRDKLMFKVDQIDLLVGGDEDSGEVHLDLEDTSSGSGLNLRDDSNIGGSAIGLVDSREGTSMDSRESTGVSVFDTGHGAKSDFDSGLDMGSGGFDEGAVGDTQLGETVDDDLSLEAVGSGSGLLDLTRESDDTSLGAELLEEVYSGDDNIEIPANASGLFEAAGHDAGVETMGVGVPTTVPVIVEAYDGAGSGLGVGMMLGAMVALICVAIIVAVGIFGATPDLAMKMTSSSNSLMIWSGGLLGVTVILGLIGLFIGKASE